MLEEVAREVRAAPGPDAWTQALFTLEAIARAAREAGDWDFAALGGASDARARSELRRGRTTRSRSSPNTTAMRRPRAPNGRWREKYWSEADAGLMELKQLGIRNLECVIVGS